MTTLNLNNVAVYCSDTVSEAHATGSGNTVKQVRGWFTKKDNRYLGRNRAEAEDAYAIRYHLGEYIDWRK